MRNRHHILLFVLLLLISGCGKEKGGQPENPDRFDPTGNITLIYLAADNNLQSGYAFGTENLNQIEAAISANPKKKIIAYFDYPGTTGAKLYYVTRDTDPNTVGSKVLKTYGKVNSCHPDMLRQALTDANDAIPGYKVTDLVLWSHGTGWLPGTAYTVPGSMTAAYTTAETPSELSFGADDSALGAQMDIKDLAAVLRPFGLTRIYFDACCMSCIEVAYEMKDCADYIVASPAEVLGTGYPYRAITGYLTEKESDPVKVAEAFYQYYNALTGANRSGTIAVIDCAKLDALAETTNNTLSKYGSGLDQSALARKTMQYTTTFPECVFDFSQYMHHLLEDYGDIQAELEKTAFDRAFAEAVPFYKHTPKFQLDNIDLSDTGGLGIYIPSKNYGDYQTWNSYIKTLKWGSASGFDYF